MPRLPPRPNLSWTDAGAPHADDFADIYFSGDGLSETRAVFLDGCNLPAAWTGRDSFTVGELGFGSGLNLLALWRLWRDYRPSPHARLHFLTFEGFPMAPGDAARIHAAHPDLAELSRELLARWPARARGVQRIDLPDNLSLTIHIDDIAAAIANAEAHCDAWFLDGFAPARNPEMWSAEAMQHIARLSRPGAIAATYTVAGDVRRNLTTAGFEVEKKPGHGRKRERLEARLPGPYMPAPTPKTIAIVGAGIAGACAAAAFRKRGCTVTLIDAGPASGSGASGNPIALVMPRLDATDTPEARGLIEAFLHARPLYASLGDSAATTLPATRNSRNEREHTRFEKLHGDPPLDETLLTPLGSARPHDGYLIPQAIAVRPAHALAALIGDASCRFNSPVSTIHPTDHGASIQLESGETIDADMVIVCAGHQLAQLGLPGAPDITPRLGQIECAPLPSSQPHAITDGGYCVEAFDSLVFGSTFQPADGPPRTSPAAREENLATLARLRPDIDAGAISPNLTSRAAIRATTRDRLPIAGPLREIEKTPGEDPAPVNSIQLIGGLGARGFLWAPLLAEIIAACAFAEPLPVEASVAAALDPDRFRQRAARREPRAGA